MEEPFAPTVLYHRDQAPALVTVEDEYHRLMATGDWAPTPAAFGMITAPSAEQQASMPKVHVPTALGPVKPDDGVAFAALLSQWQAQLSQAHESLAALHEAAQLADEHRAHVQRQYDAFAARLTTVEQRLLQLSTPQLEDHTDTPAPDASSGRPTSGRKP